MRSHFANFLAFILMSVYRAENQYGKGKGVKKERQVIHDIHLKAIQMKIIPFSPLSFDPEILEAIIVVIKAVVALLNLLGIFRNSTRKK